MSVSLFSSTVLTPAANTSGSPTGATASATSNTLDTTTTATLRLALLNGPNIAPGAGSPQSPATWSSRRRRSTALPDAMRAGGGAARRQLQPTLHRRRLRQVHAGSRVGVRPAAQVGGRHARRGRAVMAHVLEEVPTKGAPCVVPDNGDMFFSEPILAMMQPVTNRVAWCERAIDTTSGDHQRNQGRGGARGPRRRRLACDGRRPPRRRLRALSVHVGRHDHAVLSMGRDSRERTVDPRDLLQHR